jgi:Ca2+-binding EF-hand superfamily protein
MSQAFYYLVSSQYSRDREQELVKGFRLLDSNQSGKITAHDLMKLSQEMGEPLSLDEAKAVMSNGDWNPADFARLMTSR